uniref:Uncharacterized protein n=1 Tax=Anguilla anguilla TaxID=7936 RepID=A0A0E9Q9F6_ANGAN
MRAWEAFSLLYESEKQLTSYVSYGVSFAR